MIGGSSAECLYLDDSDAINAILQRELNNHFKNNLSIKVYNAGKSGDASDDHVSILVHRIIHLEPDMLILFSGINDLTRSLYNYDYLHYMKHPPKKFSLFYLLTTEFQLPRRLHYFRKQQYPTEKEIREQITLKSNYKQVIELCNSAPISNTRPKVNISNYSNNLLTMIGVSTAHKIQLIFMTQQTTWNSSVDPEIKNWHWMLYKNKVRYREELMDEALESLNNVMRTLSKEKSVPLYDLAKEMPKSSDYFYDDVHFNVNGAQVAGKDLAFFIIENDLISYR